MFCCADVQMKTIKEEEKVKKIFGKGIASMVKSFK